MKLHLPKLLFVAVVAATGFTQADTINVGKADTENSFIDNLYQRQENLTVADGQVVGYIENSKLVTDLALGLDKGTVANSLLLGDYKQKFILGFIPSGYEINGKYDLTIEGSGQVFLGGKNGSNQFASLVAKNVEIASGATGTKADGKTKANLVAGALTVETLTINGGSAFIRTEEGGGCTISGNTYDSMKSATITSGLYINDGYLMMGRQGNGSTQNTGNRGEKNAHFANIIKGELIQTGGEAEIYGKTYLNVSKIEQSGGSMKLAYDPTAAYDYLRLDTDTSIVQSGDGTSLDIEGMIISGSNGTSQRKLAIEQKGSGTISLQNGIMFKGSASKASSVTQSGGGIVNLSGDYTSTVFNLTQKELGGSINLNGNMKADVVNQDSNGSIVVSSGKALTANSVNAGVLTYEKQIVDSKEVQVVTGGSVEMNGNVSLSDGSISTADKNVTITGTLAADNITVNNGGTLENSVNSVISVGNRLVLESGSKLVNNGVITASSAYALMTADEQAAAVLSETDGPIILKEGSDVLNAGIIDADVVVQGGTLTLGEGGITQNITMESGNILVEGSAVQTGAMTLTGGTITFKNGASVALNDGITYDLSGAEIIVLVEDVNSVEGSTLTLFSGDGNGYVTGLESATFTFQDMADSTNTVGGKITDLGSGSIKVEATVAIPEPATATLSLLALAGLCARRRRK